MTTYARAIGVVLTLLLAVTLPRASWAGAPADQLKSRVDEVIRILSTTESKRPADRRAAVRKIADQIFDWEETAKRSLGRHWKDRTPQEREEFVQLFTGLLEQSYIGKIDSYGGEKVKYGGDTIEGDEAVVRTNIITPQGSEIPVNYRMVRREGDQWKVYDVVIEGVSLVANYRSQFNKIIETSSYKDLVARLKAKAASPPSS
ncbi:MAG TPA: ABC transporter substrate-binding protein [Methylomirabilota bacterium]